MARFLLNAAARQAKTHMEAARIRMAHDNLALFETFMKLRRDLAEGRFEGLDARSDAYIERAVSLSETYKPQFAFGSAWYLAGSHKTWYAKYFKDFYKATYDDAARLAATAELLLDAPVRMWRYRPDPDGIATDWESPEIDDSDWNSTDTCVETWSSIGLHGYMGKLWYRRRLRVPTHPPDKRTYLWIGATDGSARVYVNGRSAPLAEPRGTTNTLFSGYCRPVSFDITDAVIPGKTNQFAIKCERLALNELGTGGILGSPVVLYRER